MFQPLKAALAQQGIHAGDLGTLQDATVWVVALPAGSEDALEALHVKGIEPTFLPRVDAPDFCSIEQGTKNTGLVDYYYSWCVLSVLVKLEVFVVRGQTSEVK